ncbi:ABC transporter substrate-binding protein [Georgenia sp. SUBG003]|uniref:ABC transporter substrate-binding protein n=1 Tax=Georgenia sp. SUBG003 TaxID=1497974 RepID=UPI003AB648CC
MATPPDLAIFPQPGLLQRMVNDGHVVAAPDAVEEKVDEGWSEDWKNYGTVDGEFYAAPLMASVKSFVWYSPKAFEENGYEVPKTWDELMTLTQTIADEQGSDTTKPWCAGIESGGATGWPATDFIEDMVLRSAGADVYDQWVAGEIPFNDPQIAEAVDMAGDILKNPDYTNGGLGDPRTIATTSFNDGGLPILDGECFMYRMASFYEAQWPEGTDVGPDGDAFAFYLPGMTEDESPLLTAGEFVGAFNDREATQAVQAYMASGDWANTRVEIGGVVSANKAVDPELASSDVLRQAIELLQDEGAVARFDGSDLMPSEVGAGSFWTGMVDWINGSETQPVLDQIAASWPSS